MKKGLLLVICGPSGAGKGTIYNSILERMPEIRRSISVTTRPIRKGEVEGVNYYYKTIQEYQEMIAAGEFLETASVFNNYYGTPKAPVMRVLEEGSDVMFEIDVMGARQIKAKYSESVLIFVMTPSFDVLQERLKARGTENPDSLHTRLNGAKNELAQYKMFDYFVINDDLKKAVDRVEAIIVAERSRVSRNEEKIENILSERK
jgi:guanylate kinase